MDRQALPNFFGRWAVAIFAACMAMLAIVQLYSSYDVDRDAKERAEQVVSNGVEGYRRDLAKKLFPQTFWDDAVVHLDNHYDAAWTKVFIGDYFRQTDGFETVVVVGADGRDLFAQERGRPMLPSRLGAILVAAKPLLSDVRNGERVRGPLPDTLRDDQRLAPIYSQSVEQVNGDIQMLAAALVQPDSRAKVLGAAAPIVLVAKRFDNAMAATIGERFLLANPQLRLGSQMVDEDLGQIPLRNRDNAVIATLQWTLHGPGNALLRKTLPASFLFAIIVASLLAAISLRAQRLARNLVASEARATHLAFHDTLTGLPNRARLDEALAKSASRIDQTGKGSALLSIDLDQFKAVNDSLGHQAGDELIRAVAKRISRHCREVDFLARFGGDEFILVVGDVDEDAAARIAGRIIEDIGHPFELRVGRVFVGASIGIAMVASRDIDAHEALRRADLALYAAKDAGRNRYRFFDGAMDGQVRYRQDLRGKLHDALERNELSLHYQPQVDASGQIIGLEALARWELPGFGPVEPSVFVQIAEETGLIDDLGAFTFRQAFADSHRWPDLPVAINVSAVQLRAREFVANIDAMVREYAVQPSQFELEITESILLGDDPATRETLAQLRSIGFRIALDDFGTGYSSLSYLQRYPIDKVKIDRSFVARLDRDRQAEAVVVAIVQLAKAFGLSVVAEGVETDLQRDCLAAAGCCEVQGFLTGRPMPPDQLAVRIAAQGDSLRKSA